MLLQSISYVKISKYDRGFSVWRNRPESFAVQHNRRRIRSGVTRSAVLLAVADQAGLVTNTFQDRGFSVALMVSPSVLTLEWSAGFTRSGASLSFIASMSA